MQAKYAGTCSVCGERFPAGTTINYDRATRSARHMDCQPFAAPAGSWEISQGEGYGGLPYIVGAVIHNPNMRDANAPRYLMVLHASERYFRDDGYSFGVGDESGYVYEAIVRAATDEESAELRAADARAATKRQAQGEVKQIAQRIQTEGVFPEHGTAFPAGERVMDTENVYGSGSVFVIFDTGVWYLERHMMDGDAWERNNVAGTYRGWFLADATTAARVAELVALVSEEK